MGEEREGGREGGRDVFCGYDACRGGREGGRKEGGQGGVCLLVLAVQRVKNDMGDATERRDKRNNLLYYRMRERNIPSEKHPTFHLHSVSSPLPHHHAS